MSLESHRTSNVLPMTITVTIDEQLAGVHFKFFHNSNLRHHKATMSLNDAAHVRVDFIVPICCKSYHRRRTLHSSSCILLEDDSRNRTYHETRNYRFKNTTVLVVTALITMLLIQYNNSIYTLSFVRSVLSIDSVDNAQLYASIEDSNSNVTTAHEEYSGAADDQPITTVVPPRRRLLIAQYTASMTQSASFPSNIYDQFLWMTSKVNTEYAVKWEHDFWIMRGIAFRNPNFTNPQHYTIEKRVILGRRQPPWNDDCWNNNTIDNDMSDNIPQSRSTYNKIAILELALSKTEYDGLLILDADAMMYDFSRDITDLLSANTVVVAHKTNNSEGAHTGSINVGVTLWNLRHQLTTYVAQRWKSNCFRRIMHHSNDKLDDDQAPLQFLLKHELDQIRRDKVVYAIENEFYYGRGTFVRHFIRPAGSAWMNNSVDSESTRLMKIQRSVHEVCTKYRLTCDD